MSHTSSTDAKRQRKERLQLVVHWLTVFVVFMKGVTKLDHGVGYASLLFFAAFLLALGTIFHHRLEHRFPYFNAFFFVLEAAVLFLVGWLYQHDGTRMLHYAFYLSAILYVGATVVFIARRSSGSHPGGAV